MPLTKSIDTVPVEVLVEIFRLLIPENLPLLLLVCRLWRDVLYDVCDLWTRLVVKQHDTIPLLDAINITSKRASRTGIHPLTIFWRLSLKEEELTDEIKGALVQFFNNAPTSRWSFLFLTNSSGILEEVLDIGFSSLQILTLWGKHEAFDSRVLKAIDQTATSIQTMTFTNNYKEIQPHVAHMLSLIKGVEVLDNDFDFSLPENIIRLRTLDLPRNLSGIQHITHLFLDMVNLAGLIDNELPALQHLEVADEPFDEDIEEDNITLNFPELLHLKMPATAPFLLKKIVAPKLQHLHLQEPKNSTVDPEDDDERLDEEEITVQYLTMLDFNLFPSSIETLVIAYDLEAEVVSNILLTTTRLQKLDVVVLTLEDAIAILRPLIPVPINGSEAETPEDADWSLCPDLTHLTIRYDGYGEGSDILKLTCGALFHYRSFFGFKRVKILWADGTSDFIAVEHPTGKDESEQQKMIVSSFTMPHQST